MKLPNFIKFMPFLNLKAKMGIPAERLGRIKPLEFKRGTTLTLDELAAITTSGLDVGIDEVRFLQDGTIAFKDRRVLLYIRDVQFGDRKPKDPKFHVSSCKMLHQMKRSGRFEQRYVISTRSDGIFHLHYIAKKEKAQKRLEICQFCLGNLSYKGFNYNRMTELQRRQAVDGFSIPEFFQHYPISLHTDEPLYDDINAPTNTYPDNFREISLAYRESVGWKCEKCGIALGKEKLRRYLHVHHKNGAKNNNSTNNLMALCIHCHADEPLHAHLKFTSLYAEYLALTP
jgi:hypothetical protein